MKKPNSSEERIIMPDSAKSDSGSDWSIGELYSRAWQITKKYKVLWIFGMFALGAGGANSNFSNSFGSNSSPSPSPSPSPTDNPIIFGNPQLNMHDAPNVLGAATSGTTNIFTSLFSNINPGIWALLGLELLVLVLIGWAIVIIKNAFANAALLSAVENGIDDKAPTIERTSKNAMPKIKPMAWIQVVPGLILGVGALLTFALPLLLLAFGSDVVKALGGLLLIPAVIAIAYFSIKVSLASIWGTRIVVTENISGRHAFWRGVRIQKKKKWSMIGLGLVNAILGGLIFVVPILIIFAIIAAAIVFFVGSNGPGLLAIFIPLGISLGVVTAVFFVVGSGIFNAFKAVVWSLAYRKIKGKYDEK